MSSHEDQGTAYDPGATGYERQGSDFAPSAPPPCDLDALEAEIKKAVDYGDHYPSMHAGTQIDLISIVRDQARRLAHTKTLRDEFAMAALSSLVSRHRADLAWSQIALRAYEIADDMLKVRS